MLGNLYLEREKKVMHLIKKNILHKTIPQALFSQSSLCDMIYMYCTYTSKCDVLTLQNIFSVAKLVFFVYKNKHENTCVHHK